MTKPLPLYVSFGGCTQVGGCVASARIIGILTHLNGVNIVIGPHPLAYRMRTCPRTSLHKCQQQGTFRIKPLSVLVPALHSLAVSNLGEL